jgi:hypothetical protein
MGQLSSADEWKHVQVPADGHWESSPSPRSNRWPLEQIAGEGQKDINKVCLKFENAGWGRPRFIRLRSITLHHMLCTVLHRSVLSSATDRRFSYKGNDSRQSIHWRFSFKMRPQQGCLDLTCLQFRSRQVARARHCHDPC